MSNIESQEYNIPWSVRFVGMLILVAGIADMLSLVSFSAIDFAGKQTDTFEFDLGFHLNTNQVATVVILLAGALGAFIHAATSFGYHMIKKDLGKERIWWYLLRMPIGAALGYIIVGFLKSSLVADSSTASYNMNGLISTAALAGMFSKQAIDKLAEWFESILKTENKTSNADTESDQDTGQ